MKVIECSQDSGAVPDTSTKSTCMDWDMRMRASRLSSQALNLKTGVQISLHVFLLGVK